jgi:hypothetical protein
MMHEHVLKQAENCSFRRADGNDKGITTAFIKL